MLMITLYAKQKKRHRTVIWTLWEKARVGCFKRTARQLFFLLTFMSTDLVSSEQWDLV